MRAEQVSIAQRWRRPRSDPEYRKRRSDTGEISEKCSSPNGGKSSEYTKQRSDTGPATEKCARVTKWWERFSAGIAQQWSGLVQMRRIDRDHALLITPEQGLLARENLKLRLLSARLALL